MGQIKPIMRIICPHCDKTALIGQNDIIWQSYPEEMQHMLNNPYFRKLFNLIRQNMIKNG